MDYPSRLLAAHRRRIGTPRGTRMFNALIRHVRALGERTAAELKQRWRTLQHVTLSPSRIGDIARAAPTLNESGNDHR
ncbi:hypothetical protein CXR04_01880 [Streptomyces sp. CMB-StM0423]|nr:hypothetical protein CXR04_01880 [Streptomyces sp. CMB-StM0423]